jgi:hypothetical protein
MTSYHLFAGRTNPLYAQMANSTFPCYSIYRFSIPWDIRAIQSQMMLKLLEVKQDEYEPQNGKRCTAGQCHGPEREKKNQYERRGNRTVRDTRKHDAPSEEILEETSVFPCAKAKSNCRRCSSNCEPVRCNRIVLSCWNSAPDLQAATTLARGIQLQTMERGLTSPSRGRDLVVRFHCPFRRLRHPLDPPRDFFDRRQNHS